MAAATAVATAPDLDVVRRPTWLPEQIPGFDGLRGIAILAVVLYHCHTKMAGLWIEKVCIWGWAGVDLFFVLSGFLITGIILDARHKPQFYRNFYVRRILRIWPVYYLLFFLDYFLLPLLFGGFWNMLDKVRSGHWLAYILFAQNLFAITLPGTIGPTWSLAIEQQFYLFWAPIARRLRLHTLLGLLGFVLCASPFLRQAFGGRINPTHTIAHLDGLAVGGLIAVGIRLLPLALDLWRWITRVALVLGVSGVFLMLNHGSAFTSTLLAIGFGGMLLSAVLPNGFRLYQRVLQWRPLVHVGKISYSLYIMHILVFAVLGGYVDKYLDPLGPAANLATVAIRLVSSIGFASMLWKYFEQPVLGLKRYFGSSPKVSVIEVRATAD